MTEAQVERAVIEAFKVVFKKMEQGKLLDAIETYCPDYMHGIPKSEYVDAAKRAIARLERKL
jgi:hypothetical protein